MAAYSHLRTFQGRPKAAQGCSGANLQNLSTLGIFGHRLVCIDPEKETETIDPEQETETESQPECSTKMPHPPSLHSKRKKAKPKRLIETLS